MPSFPLQLTNSPPPGGGEEPLLDRIDSLHNEVDFLSTDSIYYSII